MENTQKSLFLKVFEPHWNKRLSLDPEKRLLAASARRTFCTVGDKYTAHKIVHN